MKRVENTTLYHHDTVLVTAKGRERAQELLAVEKPYRVALNDNEIGSSMVLETGLEEFGAGFLFGQGYIEEPGQVREVLVCPDGRISVHADVEEDLEPREVIITSGCGGTGKISREMLEGKIEPLQEYSMAFAEIGEFIRRVLHESDLGQKTHCVHGCGLWSDGGLQVFFEDIGRHNAVDKVVGSILLGRANHRGAVYTTGRLTSDMVLKCARIGIPIVMSRTSASSLALAIARRAGMTMVCYARPGRLNVYNAPERIIG
ncbi:MAG: formate dehydrogenase accessory sulfurtransferase FdhD [Desulfobulbaceae bacterium]|nr:formate dehydrogenase accessory sulfurtransferase FdhD [Desulfobulbaceae bacterium]